MLAFSSLGMYPLHRNDWDFGSSLLHLPLSTRGTGTV
uniref:Uncharacterized protein n=1 Tax=Arundo donax TaxID=35708 RepID=A0A0A9AZN5_ARUDO